MTGHVRDYWENSRPFCRLALILREREKASIIMLPIKGGRLRGVLVEEQLLCHGCAMVGPLKSTRKATG